MAEPPRQIDCLRRVLDITRRMAETIDLGELLGTIVSATCDVLDCERATIFLYDAKTQELYSRVGTGGDTIRFAADRGIAGAAAQQRAIIHVPDAYADARFNRDVDRQTGFVTRNLLTFPLENLAGELMGVLQALNKRGGPFLPIDEELALALSAQAGVALHRQALLEGHAQRLRMARDLELARQIQQQLFPKDSPRIDGYEIAGWNRSADETGGDCYDFVPLPDGRWAFLLADATGHGIGAALVMAQFRSLARAMLSVTDDLCRVATRVNEILSHDLTEDRFVTAFLGILDANRHRLSYVSAGQGPLLFVSPDQAESRGASGLPFAVVDALTCEVKHFDFQPSATVALLTDGFFETDNPAGEQFGEQRMIELIRRHVRGTLPEMIEAIHDEIKRFGADGQQADDLTAVLIRRNQ